MSHNTFSLLVVRVASARWSSKLRKKKFESQILEVKKGELQVDEGGGGKVAHNITRLLSEIVEVTEKERGSGLRNEDEKYDD